MSEAVRAALENTVDGLAESTPKVDAGFLWDFWYPALRSDEIYGKNLATAMLLEVPLVIGRTSEGKAFAMRDACPHRGIPLSYGHFDGKNVQCSYHGWEFDACSGQCMAIPSLTSHDKLKVERIAAGHYPCEERDGYVWVYMNAPGTRLPETLPAAPELEKFGAHLQDYTAGVRTAFAHRSRNHRVDGPGARAFCASIVVLAKQDEHSRKGEAV